RSACCGIQLPVGDVGCLSPYPRCHLPARFCLAHRLAQAGEKARASSGDGESTSPRYRTIKGGYSVKVIKAIYNFIVGDMVILIGITLAVIILVLINNVPALAPLKGFSGPFLILAVLGSLVATLSREAYSSHR